MTQKSRNLADQLDGYHDRYHERWYGEKGNEINAQDEWVEGLEDDDVWWRSMYRRGRLRGTNQTPTALSLQRSTSSSHFVHEYGALLVEQGVFFQAAVSLCLLISDVRATVKNAVTSGDSITKNTRLVF
jgi:hypothetical protein